MMQAAGDDGLEFLDLKLKMVNGKICVDVFSKPTNSFTYVLHLAAILTETSEM